MHLIRRKIIGKRLLRKILFFGGWSLMAISFAGNLAAQYQAAQNYPESKPTGNKHSGSQAEFDLRQWVEHVASEAKAESQFAGNAGPYSGPTAVRFAEVQQLRGQIPNACFADLPGGQENRMFGQITGTVDVEPASLIQSNAGEPSITSSHSPFPTRVSPDGVDPHSELYARSLYPSASECATCHQQIYDEWASSSHAYAAISPMFNAFEQKITELSQGTIGYFCLRCHAPVATTMGADRTTPVWAGPQVFREGVTCVACHRVKTNYVKPNGERRMEPGNIHQPVYGGSDGTGNAIAVKYRDFFKVRTEPQRDSPAQAIHSRAIQFEELSESTFCMSCHQVAVQPGIKLEVVWDQYRASPACREGISCQDCHMGRVPGRDEGYSIGPAAVVNNLVVNPERKHSNHVFYGPGYSIAHPGVFPFENTPDRWSFNDWQQFDWRSGWGSEEFEKAVAEGTVNSRFPSAWANVDDRMDAREKVDRNLRRLDYKRDLRRQVLENGSRVDGPFFESDLRTGEPLQFRYVVTNTNTGHNMPSGSLGAQPQIWVNVALTGPDGALLWESGYLDSHGDLADVHSLDVLNDCIPMDRQLVNFQTKFLTTNVKGTDREMPLPINVDIDQLPFLRPPQQPVSVINHPPLIRMEAHSIPPTGSRTARYKVPQRLLAIPGTYRLSIRLRSRAEPMYFMRFVDATPEMMRMMQEWTCDFHQQSVVFQIDP